MESVEAALDLARRADETMESVRDLLTRIAELSIDPRRGGMVRDLILSGWDEQVARAFVRKYSRAIEYARELAGKAKTEIEYLKDEADDVIGKVGRLV